jgi:hypothetical protein
MAYSYIYYTSIISNDGSEEPSHEAYKEPNLIFSEDRSEPILENGEEYEMAVTSAKMDLKTLPIFVPTIKYNSGSNLTLSESDRCETIYEVTLSFAIDSNVYASTQAVIFKPQDQTISDSPPDFINGYANYSTGYYNLYNYEQFFTRVNLCIRTCFLTLQDVVKTYNGGKLPDSYSGLESSGGYEIPYFIFDKESGLIYLNSPKSTFDDTNTYYFKIHLNRALYRLFNSLPFILQKDTYKMLTDDDSQTETDLTLFKLNLSNFQNSNEVDIYPHYVSGISAKSKSTHQLIYQDYETLTSWSPVESIVLTAPLLPVQSNKVSANYRYRDGFPVSTNTEKLENEILEFRTDQAVPGIIYEPKIHRWMHITSSGGLKQINFNLYYRFKYSGNLIPIKAGIGSSMAVKLVFRRLKK